MGITVSAVGIVTDNWLDGRGDGVRVPVWAKFLSTSSRPALGAHPASYPMGTGAVSRGVMQPEREADHSPPASAEVKNT
jgi:hypothetical protein